MMNAPATVTSCATTACAFNSDGCTAFAVTIGGNQDRASCSTFITLDARGGGLPVAGGGKVGACQRIECTHNDDLMCGLEAISVGGADTADCLNYEIG